MSAAVHTLWSIAAVVWVVVMSMVALLATTQALEAWVKREEQEHNERK